MTESEWLASDDPAAMLGWLGTPNTLGGRFYNVTTTARKLRLFAAGSIRQVGDRLTDPRSRRAVEVAERFADGEAAAEEMWTTRLQAHNVAGSHLPGPVMAAAECCVEDVSVSVNRVRMGMDTVGVVPPAAQAALLRCVFGSPWRPVVACIDQQFFKTLPPRGKEIIDLRDVVRWNDHTVPRIAETIYGGWEKCHACDGEGKYDADNVATERVRKMTCRVCGGDRGTMKPFDASRLPILADALEEAGCDDEAILAHCRGVERCPDCFHQEDSVRVYCECGKNGGAGKMGWIKLRGPHVRGCWVIDLILGRE